MPNTDRPRTYRLREYTVTRDQEPDAEPHAYAMQCAVCFETGPPDADPDTAHGWVPAHLRAHPAHLTYREHVTRPYRAIPGRWL
ncbi:hypothetical protein [Streptomyces sulphureus]|uniref:DUF7848 domain-containing protein n=1 Tax=Streptomyces sulphureus TaxID=47758 RepID=UPI00035CCBC0|nr:hypothetical protein [Streptomyces sulphureus]